MAIGRGRRGPGAEQADRDWEALNPPRVYNESELKDFHQKIQKFYKDKTLTTGEVVRIFDHDEFAVAFGAYSKLMVGSHAYYRARATPDGKTKRCEDMYNILGQHEEWMKKQDWIDAKKAEEFDFMAQQIPEKELSTGVLA